MWLAICSQRCHVQKIVTWNMMIHGCHENGFPMASLQLSHLMQQHDGSMPGTTTVLGVIEAITQRGYRRNYKHNLQLKQVSPVMILLLIPLYPRMQDSVICQGRHGVQ